MVSCQATTGAVIGLTLTGREGPCWRTMSETFPAFQMSPVPEPGPDAVAPGPFRGIYGMPMFVTLEVQDLGTAADFWQRALGFIELFSIPGQVVHLRRWAFQDVLLVPAREGATTSAPPRGPQVSFACVLAELDDLTHACRELAADVTGPADTPWNTTDLHVVTPDGVRVVMTAAKPWDPDSATAKDLLDSGISDPVQLEGEPKGRSPEEE